MEWITDHCLPIVLIACLIVGYLMKNFMPTDNKWVPLTVTILGAVLGCVAMQQITLDAIVSGAVSGLGSTGLHQIFKQFIDDGSIIPKDDDINKYIL